jgi:hypothetical protein
MDDADKQQPLGKGEEEGGSVLSIMFPGSTFHSARLAARGFYHSWVLFLRPDAFSPPQRNEKARGYLFADGGGVAFGISMAVWHEVMDIGD